MFLNFKEIHNISRRKEITTQCVNTTTITATTTRKVLAEVKIL